jgi:hypothetical protein
MVLGNREFNIGIRKQNMGGDNFKVRHAGSMNREWVSLQNGGVQRVLRGNLGVVREQHFGGIGLTINVNQERCFAFSGNTGGKRD